MSAQLTLGVIGHVDHGKTALVRALTGVDTDRLREEKARGLSIVLGFAYIETARGIIDLIDAPGHEDFIRAMISGATGIDGVILVIAANEGIMPQTREHFDIARLLGVDLGVVVITKTDLVSDDVVDAAERDVRDWVAGSFLEPAPVLRTSAETGAGIDVLDAWLERALSDAPPRPPGHDFYLPLDRVFTIRGFGAVGTGTLRGGGIRAGDRVEILPSRSIATVRALQRHNRSIDEAHAGERVAVNLRGVKRDEIRRGDTLAAPGLLTPSRRIDAEISLLDVPELSLKNAAWVRVLVGTTEAVARLRLLDRPVLAAGETAFVQLRCDRDVVCRRAEHLLIRSYSPMRTIGGGLVVDPNAERHRRFDDAVDQRLKAAAAGDAPAMLAEALAEHGLEGADVSELRERLGVPSQRFDALVSAAGAVRTGSDRLVAGALFDALCDDLCAALASWHAEQPSRPGIGPGKLKKRLAGKPAQDVFDHALKLLGASGRLRSRAGLVSSADFDPFAGLDDRERRQTERLEQTYRDAGLEAPPADAVLSELKAARRLQQLLIDSGRLVALRTYDRKGGKLVHADTLDDVRKQIRAAFPYPAKFTVAEIRDLLGSTRKHVVPLMEHFDATGFTARVGDERFVQDSPHGGE